MDALDTPPSPRFRVVRMTNRHAATEHLDAAIFLWFQEQASAVTLTLATMAQEVISRITSYVEGSGQSKIIIGTDKSERKTSPLSGGDQDRLRNWKNFMKHGINRQPGEPTDTVTYTPEVAEPLMFDAIETFHRVFRYMTPLMHLFALRYSLSHPERMTAHPELRLFLDQARVPATEGAGLPRRDFYEEFIAETSLYAAQRSS